MESAALLTREAAVPGSRLSSLSPEPTVPMAVATGFAGVAWPGVVATLRAAGLPIDGDALRQSHDAVFAGSRELNPLAIQQPHSPDPELAERVSSLLMRPPQSPVLLADPRSLWLLDFWAAKLPSASFLLFYAAPSALVAEALPSALDPAHILNAWECAARHLLRFYRRHRQRAVVLNAEAICVQPELLMAACQRLGIPARPSMAAASPPPAVLSLERLVADQIEAAHPGLHVVMGELAACTMAPATVARSAETQAREVIAVYTEHLAAQRALQRKVGETHAALQRVTKELTERAAQLNAAQQANQWQAAQLSDLDAARQAHQLAEAELRNERKENEGLLLHLHQVQEALERLHVKYSGTLRQTREQKKTAAPPSGTQVAPEKRDDVVPEIAARPGSLLGFWKKTSRARAQVQMLRKSGLFDEAWYLNRYPDVAREGLDPIEHYVRYGAYEGRDPSPTFQTKRYTQAHPETERLEINPLVHFAKTKAR